MSFHGALLIDKPKDVSSFGVLRELQSKLKLKKLGHGGTLDPFATGLLVILVGRGAKLARYSLGARKKYEGVICFGETTVPGDPTDPISERSDVIPHSSQEILSQADLFLKQPYEQTPPMHSAKKHQGKPLYLLARKGIEIERKPKICHLDEFKITHYDPPHAHFELKCSAGTYVRTFAQDLGRALGTVAYLKSLRRVSSGAYEIQNALSPEKIFDVVQKNPDITQLSCWVAFDQMLQGYPQVEATLAEAQMLTQGKQNALFDIIKRAPNDSQNVLVITHQKRLVAAVRRESTGWELERVFTTSEGQ